MDLTLKSITKYNLFYKNFYKTKPTNLKLKRQTHTYIYWRYVFVSNTADKPAVQNQE